MLAEGILIFWMRDVVKGPPEAGGISDETPLRFSPSGSGVPLDMEAAAGGPFTVP
jgi:hypothetical protein